MKEISVESLLGAKFFFSLKFAFLKEVKMLGLVRSTDASNLAWSISFSDNVLKLSYFVHQRSFF